MNNLFLVLAMLLVPVLMTGCGGCSKQEAAAVETTNQTEVVLGKILERLEALEKREEAPMQLPQEEQRRMSEASVNDVGFMGARGSGYKKGDPNELPVVLSLTKRQDRILGEVYLPNYREGRAIATPPGKPAPQVVFDGAEPPPDGYRLTPYGKDRGGNTIWVFARP